MKASEAIIILEDLQTTLPQVCPEKRRLAVQLGKEALKRILNCRKHPSNPIYSPLPGESEWRDPPYRGHIFNHLPVQKEVKP